MIITIIGGGSTSISFLYNYLQQLEDPLDSPGTIYLVEKRGVFGPGAAYEEDASSNILNTKTGFISPFHDRPGDFFRWLNESPATWKKQFPRFDPLPDSYAPRPLFGMYLQTRVAWLVKLALTKNINIIQIDAEATDVIKVGKSHITKTDCSLSLQSDHVFLLCGTLPSKSLAAKTDRVLSTPYPIRGLKYRIPESASVAIAGARLSCIDAVIGLVENGHKGTITIHSRSGYFPSVRGTQGRIVPKVLTADSVNALMRQKGKLRIRDVAQLVLQEISLISDKEIHCSPLFPPSPPKDLASFLEEEIELAKNQRIWQAVLYSTNGIIDLLWNALEESEQAVFLEKYFSVFMSYRVSIPTENAAKILSYLRSGQVRFQAGDFAIHAEGETVRIDVTDKKVRKTLEYDYVIEAVGSPRAVSQLDSTLIDNLLRKGAITPHRMGGITVDRETYQVIDGAGARNANLYAVGELTTGLFFFTSALDINSRHARKCATHFAQSIAASVEETQNEVLALTA